ncbi:Poly-beta-1,6-N-acetyl-D-glucosamine synthase [compost metagenome]
MFWVIWYPLVFWLISLLTTLVSFPKVLFSQNQKRARWVSPDRGIKPLSDEKEDAK